MKMLKFKIDPTENFSPKEKVRLEEARVKLEICVNHPRFKQLFFQADFSGETSHWKNKRRVDIWNHFMSGAETLQPEIDNEADITQDIFNPSFRTRNTVGYTYKTVITQWINRKFFWAWKLVKIASNILHEWGHKLGFDHDFKRTARRPFSICYQLNRILEQVWSEVIDETLPTIPTPKPKKKRAPLWRRIVFFWRY